MQEVNVHTPTLQRLKTFLRMDNLKEFTINDQGLHLINITKNSITTIIENLRMNLKFKTKRKYIKRLHSVGTQT